MLTKAEERKLIEKMLTETPDGYVLDLLREAAPLWEQAITNDMCVIGLRELWDSKRELGREVAALEAKAAKLKQENRDAELRLSLAINRLDSLQAHAEQLAEYAREYVRTTKAGLAHIKAT